LKVIRGQLELNIILLSRKISIDLLKKCSWFNYQS